MDAIVIFSCLFLAVFLVNLLSASREQLLFERHPGMRVSSAIALVSCSVVGMVALGLPLSWALAMALAGPAGSWLGTWVGHDGLLVALYRVEAFWHRSAGGH